jgi:hypothetical protein
VLKQLDTLIGFAVVMSVVSMLIMVSTQAISSLLALRGKNLLDALQALFTSLVPKLDPKKAAALADVILKRPIISDSSLSLKNSWVPERWKLATAIRAEECLAAIKKIASTDEDQLKQVLDSKAQSQVPAAQAAAVKVIEALSSSEAKTGVEEVLTAVKAIVPTGAGLDAVQAKVSALVAHAGNGGPPDGGPPFDVARWLARFQSVQDRANQWFTVHARITTVVFAFVAAFILQLNTFDLFSRLANDADLRNQLVNLSPNIQRRVDEALNVKFPGTVYAAALKELKAKGEISSDPSAVPAESDASARQWLTSQKVTAAVLTDYENMVQENATARARDAKEEFKQMVGLYDQTTLQLIPENYPLAFGGSPPYIHNIRGFLGFTGQLPGRAFFGMFASAMLLSLGSPFWFNLLKSLASLRSSVSEKIDQQEKQKTA